MPTAFKKSIPTLILIIFFLLFFNPRDAYSLTYYAPGSNPNNPSATLPECTDTFSTCGTIPLNDCTTYGNLVKDNQCFQNPWKFKYAANCTACSDNDPFTNACSFTYEYQYNECNTQDRCWGSTVGASGNDAAGRIIPGICSASSYNGTDPNSACTSGGHYKQCCTAPAPGFTPSTACSNGVCPSGYKTSAGDTTCDAPEPTATPIPPTPTPIPDPCLNAPTGLNRTCSANGASLSFGWNSTSASCKYAIRIDENPVSWGGDTVLAGDTVDNNVTSASFSRSSTPGQTYAWWLHSVSPISGNYSPSTTGTNITCPVPPTLPPGVTPTATPVPTATPIPTVGPTPTTAPPDCTSCGTNANCGGNPPTFPASCPTCSGSWVYQSAGDSTCASASQGTTYPYCWACSAPLPTAPVPSGAPTPTPTPPGCAARGTGTCSTQANIGNCEFGQCSTVTKTCWGTCSSGGTLTNQSQVSSCITGGDSVTSVFWGSYSGSCPVAPSTYTVSGTVFIDRNANGRKEADEVGYSGGAKLYLGTQNTTTDLNGSYQFTSVTSGSYTLELDMPFGFSPTKSTGYDTTTGTNKLAFSIPPAVTSADFGLVPYEVGVGGTMYTTLDGTCSTGITPQGRLASKSLSLLENYFGLTFSTSTDSNGAYSFSYPNQTLFPSSYSLTPLDVTGTRLVCAVVDAGSVNATALDVRSTPYSYGPFDLTAVNPQKRVDFYYQLVQPWFQGKGADMRIDSGFKDPVSASARDPYAMLSNGRSPGVIFSGSNSYSFCAVASAGTCLAQSSQEQWVAGGTASPEAFTSAIAGTTRTSYGYLLGLVQQNGQTINEITNSDCYNPARGCNLAGLDPGIYTNQTGQNNVYTRNSKSQFNSGDYVFLINGNLHIQGEIGLVNTPNDAVLVVSASGDITVNKDVGGSSPSSSSTHIEGLFSADSDFILESEGTDGDNCPSEKDERLNIKGAVVANALLTGGTFQNNRTLCDDNSDYPVLYIEESPYLILNAPDFLKHKSFVWQEVAP